MNIRCKPHKSFVRVEQSVAHLTEESASSSSRLELQYRDSAAEASAAIPTADTQSGRKTEKHVPLRPVRVLLRRRIEPSCFLTIPLLTQRPNPVPRSPFVVTNGSKSRLRLSGEMPTPLSAITTRTPERRALLHSREANVC